MACQIGSSAPLFPRQFSSATLTDSCIFVKIEWRARSNLGVRQNSYCSPFAILESRGLHLRSASERPGYNITGSGFNAVTGSMFSFCSFVPFHIAFYLSASH